MAGIGAALALKKRRVDFVILEKDNLPGGLVNTDLIHDFLFDRAGHYLHIKTKEAFDDLVANTIPFDSIETKSGVLIEDNIVPYPLQYNLWAVDSRIRENVRAEIVSAKRNKCINKTSLHHCLKDAWGKTLFELFLNPYNTKLWACSTSTLPYDSLGKYALPIDSDLVIEGCKGDVSFRGYNHKVYIPKTGRVDDLVQKLIQPLSSHLRCATEIVKIDANQKKCVDRNGEAYFYDVLISSVPLNKILERIAEIRNKPILQGTSLLNIRVGIKGCLTHPYHWLYVPDEEQPFHRIGFPSNVNAKTCPQGYTSLSIEYTPKKDNLLNAYQIAEAGTQYLQRRNLLRMELICFSESVLIRPAYTCVATSERDKVKHAIKLLSDKRIFTVGRYGSWEYLSMEDSFLSGKHVAECL